MNWQLWIVVGFLALSAIISVSQIGKPRPPLTPGVGAATVIVMSTLIVLVLWGAA